MQPIAQRQVEKVRTYYEEQLETTKLECIWTGKQITSQATLHIDHMLPFSKYRNNDLWNLVPSHSSVNRRKKDWIPSTKLLKKRKPEILNHWRNIENYYPTQFNSEAQYSLTGYRETEAEDLFKALLEKTDYLITQRRYREWNG